MMTVFVIIFLVTVILSIMLIAGIDKMQEDHPDYKGEDFLDWDDNKQHTENV